MLACKAPPMSTCIKPSPTAKFMHSFNTIMAHLDTGMLNDVVDV